MSLARAAAALVLAAALAASHGVRAETHTVVKPGDEVEWVNKDLFEHTATATGNAFDSKAIKAGQSWKWKAGEAGQYPYVCSFHGNMKGVVNVKP